MDSANQRQRRQHQEYCIRNGSMYRYCQQLSSNNNGTGTPDTFVSAKEGEFERIVVRVQLKVQQEQEQQDQQRPTMVTQKPQQMHFWFESSSSSKILRQIAQVEIEDNEPCNLMEKEVDNLMRLSNLLLHPLSSYD